MIKYVACLILLQFFFTEGFSQKASGNVRGVRVTTTLPIPDRDTNITVVHIYDVYYWNNMRCYRVTVDFDSSMNGISVLHENRSTYFVFSKDSVFGTNFDLTNRRIGTQIRRLKVDSFTSTYRRTFDEVRDPYPPRPDRSFTTGKGEFVYTFEFKKTKQYPEDFTYLYYYAKEFNGILESLSKKYDTAKGMKLFKVVIDAHGAYYASEKFKMPPRQYIYKMDLVSKEDIDLAFKYFNEYLKMQKK